MSVGTAAGDIHIVYVRSVIVLVFTRESYVVSA